MAYNVLDLTEAGPVSVVNYKPIPIFRREREAGFASVSQKCWNCWQDWLHTCYLHWFGGCRHGPSALICYYSCAGCEIVLVGMPRKCRFYHQHVFVSLHVGMMMMRRWWWDGGYNIIDDDYDFIILCVNFIISKCRWLLFVLLLFYLLVVVCRMQQQ